MSNAEKSNEWAEIESSPEFKKLFLNCLIIILLEKSFDKDFLNSYLIAKTEQRIKEEGEGDTGEKNNDNLPKGWQNYEMIERDLASCTDIEQLTIVARANRLIKPETSAEIPQEYINKAKTQAIKLMESESI